jgi:hypothetical protein
VVIFVSTKAKTPMIESHFSHKVSGADRLKSPIFWAAWLLIVPVLGFLVAKMGWMTGLGMLALPLVAWGMVQLFKKPETNLWAALVLSFFISGLSRYLALPWGLGIDILLFIGLLAMFFTKFRDTNWKPIRNDIVFWGLIWFGYVVFELVNPEARSAMAWFYAMRGIGFYQLLSFVLVFMLWTKPAHLDKFIRLTVWLSIMGTLWGLRQKIFGTDAAEDHWLWAEGHHDEHVLFGVLRVFSFYSDAGQFGASQAMFALLCGILALNPEASFRNRLFFAVAALITFIGFGISGTRGAMAVPAAGGLIFLIVSKNFRLLFSGLLIIGLTFYLLKYTHVAHNVEQVRRFRTALSDDNPSLNARLRNQVTFGNHLRSRPFGGGIGTAGFWGNRFSPNTLLADTPTDSYYVKVWAETGIVGICLHLLMLGYFMGKGAYISLNLKNTHLRYKVMALFCSYGGVLLASYGNQVFSQMPTGMIMSLAIPLIFLSPRWDTVENRQRPTANDSFEKIQKNTDN